MTVKAQKIEKQTVKLKFTDPSGYSVEGATVLISTAFTRKEYTLGADGILSAEVFVESRNAEAKSISVQIFGKNGNIQWNDSRYLSLADVLNGEYEIRINSLISIRMDGAAGTNMKGIFSIRRTGRKSNPLAIRQQRGSLPRYRIGWRTYCCSPTHQYNVDVAGCRAGTL